MFRILLYVCGSVAVGYIVHLFLYWWQMHALVGLENDICSGIDLIICRTVSGFVLALL